MKASNVTETLFHQLGFRGERQKVITSNIANINTPGYKTKDLVFDKELEKASDSRLQLSRTHANHLPIGKEISQQRAYNSLEVKGLQEQTDGNNVNLDTQMGEMSKNKILFDAIQSSIKKDSRLFRSVIESSAKN